MKTLVVYYSRTHNTKKVAEEIKDQLDSDIEGIISKTKYDGKIGFVKGAKDARGEKEVEILTSNYDPSKYDLTIIGTPVWAGNISTPVLTYINNNKNKFNDVAFFITAKSDKAEDVLNKMNEHAGKNPVSTLMIKESEIDNIKPKVTEFISKIE